MNLKVGNTVVWSTKWFGYELFVVRKGDKYKAIRHSPLRDVTHSCKGEGCDSIDKARARCYAMIIMDLDILRLKAKAEMNKAAASIEAGNG